MSRLTNIVGGIGLAALASVVISIPIVDWYYRQIARPVEIENTRITSIESHWMKNDFGTTWNYYTVECDSLDGEISFSESEMGELELNVDDSINLKAYKLIPVFGMNRGYDGTEISKL